MNPPIQRAETNPQEGKQIIHEDSCTKGKVYYQSKAVKAKGYAQFWKNTIKCKQNYLIVN